MRKYQQAFTLVELVITVAIAAIVLGLALPSFNTQIRNNSSVALGHEFASALNFARSEAIKRGARVSICASNNGVACVGAWTDGWLIFVDSALSDNAIAPVFAPAPAVPPVLQYWDDIDPRAVIGVSNNKAFIRFTALGTLGRVDNNPVVITSLITNCKNNAARTIRVGLSGEISIAPANCP